MASDKFEEYMNFQIHKTLSELRVDKGSKEDILLLENYVVHAIPYYSGLEYHLRVDHDNDDEKVAGFIDKFASSYKFVYVYHEISKKEKKPHYHIHLVFNDKVKIDSVRRAYNRYWERSGTQLTLTADKGLSRIYTVKDLNRCKFFGVSPEILRIYELVSKPKQEDLVKEERKKRKEKGIDIGNPMEVMLEAFKMNVQMKVEKYNAEHLDKRELEFYYTDRFIGIFVMEWYAKHLKKSFMINKMSECMMFIRYHVNNFGEDNVDEITLSRLMEKSFG